MDALSTLENEKRVDALAALEVMRQDLRNSKFEKSSPVSVSVMRAKRRKRKRRRLASVGERLMHSPSRNEQPARSPHLAIKPEEEPEHLLRRF